MAQKDQSVKLRCARAIVQAVYSPTLILDQELRVRLASRAFFDTFNVSEEQTENRLLTELGGGEWGIPELRTLLLEVLAKKKGFTDFSFKREFRGLGQREIRLSAGYLQESDSTELILLGIEDVTDRLNSEAEASRQRQWFATTLSSIGDAVIATDTNARVTFMNPAAERLTGWMEKEAVGKPLLDVFNIINEDTRKLVESPVDKALRSGHVVGLANHTMLIAKDGKEYPIDDSAAPIRDSNGQILGVVLVFHDVTERHAADRIQGRLAEIVESSDDAIVAKDLNGIVTAWNKGAEKLFGYKAEEIIGKSILMILPPDRKAEEATVLEKIRRGERIDHFETTRQRNDGTQVEISLTASPIRNRMEEIIGVSKIARDITERRRAEARVQMHLSNEQAMRLEAERANRSKDLFLATLSHELRTPLNAIVGWIGILRAHGCTPEDLTEGLEVIERNTKMQTQLIEDVLDVSRIVSGKLTLNMQPCDFITVISAAADSVRPAAEAKGIKLDLRLDPDARSGIADQARIQQIVWNLLSNAIKFTPKDGRVSVSLDRQRSMTRIEVRDTGQGIGSDFMPFLFERFRQADSSTRRKFGGLGLGLSIVKQLVELHGGTVRAESSGEGQGSTFIVELPVAAVILAVEDEPEVASTDTAPITRGGVESIRLNGLRILIVDDESDSRRVLARVLTDFGAMVTAAGSADEALAFIERERPQILVSDIAMPEKDGYDLIRQVRAKGLGAKVLPAVALTAFAQKEHARHALLAGFQVHVAKPVDSRDLIAVVASLTERTGDS